MTDADQLALGLELADLADTITVPRFRAADLRVTTKPDLTPVSDADAVLRTQTLVGMVIEFGTASGAPKRQPVLVQLRLLPVSSELLPPRVAVWPVHSVMALTARPRSGTANGSGTEFPPPPV